MRKPYISARVKLGIALGLASITSCGLYVAGVWGSYEHDFAYMMWNLFLAWIALLLALWLERTIHRTLWSSWYALTMTLAWLLFLPNTFYMVTDFIHVRELANTDLLNGIFMFSSFIFTGFILGFVSTYIVHTELKKRIGTRPAAIIVGLVLLICSFAMYIGRELRWNSWDIVTNPSLLLFDVTDRLLNMREHPHVFTITMSFFVFLASTYTVLWWLVRAARSQPAES